MDLQFSNGNRARFNNNIWDRKFSDIHVFDLDFIDNNVYSGGEIKPGHRQKLLSFALGHSAVTARTEFNTASEAAAECSRIKREAETRLTGYRGQLSLAQYIRMANVDNLDALISANIDEQAKAHRIDTIKEKQNIKKLSTVTFNATEFFKIMMKTVEKINEGAESIVKPHLDHINIDGIEKWINDGQPFIKDETCPFCAQNIGNLDLIEAYKSYFNLEYSNFIKEITTLTTKKDTILEKINIPVLQQEQTNIVDTIETWKEFLELQIVAPDFEAIENLKNNLDVVLTECISSKTSSPLNEIDQHYQEKCQSYIDSMNEIIGVHNGAIDAINAQIDDYKKGLENINLPDLVAEQTRLASIQTRFSQPVLDLLADHSAKRASETTANATKETKRTALNELMTETLGRYEASINALLVKFGASFNIEEISYNYSGGGEPRTEYGINLRGQRITLQGEDAGFKTCLSEGDKRTLAFAFFISVISEDPDLSNKIVVIDDPMCSFDTHRKQQTVTVLKQINDRSKQLIILAHDAFFIKALRDEFLKRVEPNEISLIKVVHTHGQFSNLITLNLDTECESAYYKNHRLVSSYVNGELHNERDVAVAIRPLLEGYLHRRFPSFVPSSKLFGEIVHMIVSAQPNTPLHNAIPISAELTEINSYAGKFHHDTNPNAGAEPVIQGELLSFCNRALNIIYKI